MKSQRKKINKNNIKKDKFSKVISFLLMILIIMQPLMDALTYLQIRYSFNFLSISSVLRTLTFSLTILYLLFTFLLIIIILILKKEQG